jgi:hypothetical protein
MLSRQQLLRHSKTSQLLTRIKREDINSWQMKQSNDDYRVDDLFEDINSFNEIKQPQPVFKSALDRFGKSIIACEKI